MENKITSYRKKCLSCMRPETSCMCQYIKKIKTNTKFVILIHPMEFKKVKNNTGRLTYLSLENSEFIMGIDFENNKHVNTLIKDYNAYVLYPGSEAINLSKERMKNNKNNLIFIIDATWPCSKKMMRLSPNLQKLPKVSFSHSEESNYQIKKQPKKFCLSTIESTKVILNCLNNSIEKINSTDLDNFLMPFEKMIEYQISCKLDKNRTGYRKYKPELNEW